MEEYYFIKHEQINKGERAMIIMDIKVDNFYAFKNFHMNMSYPKKIVDSTIEEEFLEERPNFRYKKVNIIMGGNATGKTSLGRLLMLFTNYLNDGGFRRFTDRISDEKKEAKISIDFVTDTNILYRFEMKVLPKEKDDYSEDEVDIKIYYTPILIKDNYEMCANKLNEKNCSCTTYDKINTNGWSFSYPIDVIEEKKYKTIEENDKYIFILEQILKTLDPSVKEVVKVNQITEGVIWQQILIFFLPILFGTFFQQLYNTADAMIVGHFLGKQALAAVGGTTGTLINLLVGFFVGLSSGATVVISQHYGANKEDKVQWAVHTSIAFSILGGIVLTVVGIGCSRWMLDLMSTPDDVVNYALIYMRVYFLGTIGNLIYNMGSGILRAVGDSKRPLLYLIICCMTNIALDFLFVVGLQMGVMGAALATILSQIISAVLVMGSLMRTRDIYRLHLRKISIDWIMLKRIVRIGFPAGVQSILYSVSNVIIQSAVNSLGTNNVAAWAAYGKVDGLFWMMINALGIAATTFVGQNYGAKKMDRVHRGVRTSMIMAFLMTGLMVVFMWFIGDTLISLFTTDTAVREICHGLIHFLVPTFFTYISIEILSGALRGVGDAWIPMFITGIGICGVRIVWMTAVLPHFHSLKGAAFCYPLSWVITTIAYFIYYLFFSQLSKRKELRSI